MSNVASLIAERFIAAIKTTKVLPWQKQFVSLAPCNATTKKPYRGINVLLTSFFGTDNEFVTFNQARNAGGTVKKGAKGLPICFYSKIDKKDGTKPFFFLRYSTVFNLSDTEGVKIARRALPNSTHNPIEAAEKIVALASARISHGSNQPCYIPASHQIKMPLAAQYKTTAAFYKTLFHEITHSLAKDLDIKLDASLVRNRMPPKNWWQKSARICFFPIVGLTRKTRLTIRRHTLKAGFPN